MTKVPAMRVCASPSCEVEFVPRAVSQHFYCSPSCRPRRPPKVPGQRTCPTCGTEFSVRRRKKYCSPECRRLPTQLCSVCDEPFTTAAGAKGMCRHHYLQTYGQGKRAAGVPVGLRTITPAYPTVHARLRRERGNASAHPCATCGGPAKDWAFDNAEPKLIDPISGSAYFHDLDRYIPLCRSCHTTFDQNAKG